MAARKAPTFQVPKLGGKYKGAAVGTSPAYGCSAQVVELSVDLETGCGIEKHREARRPGEFRRLPCQAARNAPCPSTHRSAARSREIGPAGAFESVRPRKALVSAAATPRMP